MVFAEQQPEAQKPASPPDKNQDPLGFMEWQQKQIERLEQTQQAQQNEYRQSAQLNSIDSAYKQSWSAFSNRTPDALDAYQHFVNATAVYLEMQGVPEDQLNDFVVNEERKITVAAMKRGISPAELIYEKAKALGFQPKQAQQQDTDDAAKKAEADIERRQKAAGAAKSLSNAGGTRGGQTPSALEIASMSDDDFADMRVKLGDKVMRKLMGG